MNPLTIEGNKLRKSHSTMSAETCITPVNSLGHSSRNLEQFGKKKSRVSLKLDQMESNSMIREYEELVRGDYDDEESMIPNYNIDMPISFKAKEPQLLSIKMNIFLEVAKVERIFTITLQIQKRTTIRELIPIAIEQFNQGNYQIEITKDNKAVAYELRFQIENYGLYSIHSSKKNSKPKLDMPQFDLKTTVEDTFTSSFSLVFNPDSLLMRKISKGCDKEDSKKRGVCTGCLIV